MQSYDLFKTRVDQAVELLVEQEYKLKDSASGDKFGLYDDCVQKNIILGSKALKCTCKVSGHETFMKAKYAINKLKEPTTELIALRDVLRAAADKDQVATDAVFAKFLYEECAPKLI